MIRLVNKSAKMDAESLAAIIAALRLQSDDVQRMWGIAAPDIGTGAPEPGDWILTLDDGDYQGDLGWHSNDGQPFGWVGVSEILGYGGGLIAGSGDGSPSVSSVISHEVCELLVDPLASLWEPRPDGTAVALEVCDPVQGLSYQVAGVDLSDFITPAWFLASGRGAPDFLSRGVAGQLSPGGYMSIRGADGSTSQVTAERAPSGYWAARMGRRRRRAA